MAVFKCKMCGGSLDILDGVSVATCEYCGTKQTVPKSRDEVIANLFNRANNLRLKCEFDKAEQVYEKILDIDNSDSEAHWGVVLCKYGIEYVEDPKTYSRIPTCHRTLYEAVLTDVDYLAAIENADTEQKELYIAEAKIIDELQKNILTIVNSEEPFDVFICYKETDEDGKRTVDSVIANDIYYQLTQEGFKVFYAPITLEDKLGHEYEPYIFAALNSAKVMLVVGTKPEYFDSVWVRNEWSRFIKLTKSDRSKMIIPCYRNMDAYELPDEFAHLQAQDMGKIGFITDVIRGLKKVFNRDEQPKESTPKTKPKKKKRELWKEIKRKRENKKSSFHLSFPMPKAANIFFIFSFVFYIYYLIKVGVGAVCGHDFFMFSLVGLPLVVLLLIFAKIIKKKSTAMIMQILSSIWCFGFMLPISDYTYQIECGFNSQIVILALIFFAWIVLLCFAKKKENTEKTKARYSLITILTTLISIVIIVVFEIYGVTAFDYQLANIMNHIGAHENATEYFIYLGDYKDSRVLATKSKLLEIKNSKIMGEVRLGNWVEENSVYDGTHTDLWYVVSKEDDKVLLLNEYSITTSESFNLLGGWNESTIREFLNNEYYNKSFSDDIKNKIILTSLSSDSKDSPKDKIFILSKEEYEKYVPLVNDRAKLCSWGDDNIIMRNYNNKKYYIMQSDGSFSEFDYPYNYIPQIDTNGDGKTSLSEYNKHKEQYGEYLDAIKKLNAAQYKTAMWIDISGIN